jgi:RNA-splicing ligase RtcB
LCIAHANLNCPVINLAHKAIVDTQAIGQLEQTAHTLPGLIHAVGQPDLHPGNKFPIGAVFVSEGWIHPPLIGGDIGCGMAWYRIESLSRRQVDGDKGKKISENLRGLEGPWQSQRAREIWLTKGTESYSAGLEWDKSLGTIGAGNHFAELQVVESSQTDQLKEDQVLLLVHSGSRGYGGDVLKRHTIDQNSSFQEESPEAKAYMEEHERACGWAKANRDLIALRFLACLEPGNEDWSIDIASDDKQLSEVIQNTRRKIESRKVVDIWHNNVEKIPWPPSAPSADDSLVEATSSKSLATKQDATKHKFAYVHRKGAAPTYSPETRVPLAILPLPGSRGTPTLILRPKFSDATGWGLHNAMSLAHGAGRSMSRANALSSLGAKYKDSSKLLTPTSASQDNKSANGEDVHGGTWGTF